MVATVRAEEGFDMPSSCALLDFRYFINLGIKCESTCPAFDVAS
jgi:hypothetical protein